MRVTLLIVLCITSVIICHAQNPVNWKYNAKKIADKTYEVHLIATVQSPWHIYSQTTPDSGPLPTKISFHKNPMVTFAGELKEGGKLLRRYEEVFGIDVKYFESKADFIQVVKLKNNVKTNINGTIEFMACNDEQCLPPATINFSVKLE